MVEYPVESARGRSHRGSEVMAKPGPERHLNRPPRESLRSSLPPTTQACWLTPHPQSWLERQV